MWLLFQSTAAVPSALLSALLTQGTDVPFLLSSVKDLKEKHVTWPSSLSWLFPLIGPSATCCCFRSPTQRTDGLEVSFTAKCAVVILQVCTWECGSHGSLIKSKCCVMNETVIHKITEYHTEEEETEEEGSWTGEVEGAVSSPASAWGSGPCVDHQEGHEPRYALRIESS